MASTEGDAIEWFALDQELIYFADCGTVWSVPKSGGFPTVLSSGEAKCPLGSDSVVQDASTLFFLRGRELFRLAKTGGAPQQMLEASAMALAGDSDHIYWMDLVDNAIMSVDKTGGAPITVSNADITSFKTLSEHAGYLYWMNGEGLARISTAGPFPAAASTLPLDAHVNDFFAVNGFIYFISSLEGSVGKVNLESGLVTTLATAGSGQVTITADERAVYWLSHFTQTELRKVGVEGGAPTTIATLRAGGGNNRIATDEKFVYWTQGSTLMRAVK